MIVYASKGVSVLSVLTMHLFTGVSQWPCLHCALKRVTDGPVVRGRL